jgi:hypothetical protein
MTVFKITGTRMVATTLVAALSLAGCTQPAGPRAGASPAQTAACRQRSEEVYLTQNRGDVYRADTYATSTRDAPFGGGLASVPSSGLSQRYARDQMLDDCLRSSAGNIGEQRGTVPLLK